MQPWIIYSILAALSASFVAIFGKIGITKVDSTLATTLRALIMSLFLVAIVTSLGKWGLVKTVDSKALLYITASAIMGALSWLFYFFALKYGPTSVVSAIDKTSIIFVFIFALLFLGEKFTLYKTLGALLVGCGVILMAL